MTRKSAARTQALPADVNEAGRAALRALIDARWEGNAAAAARAFGLRKQTVSEYLNGESGGGGRLAGAAMRYDPEVAAAMLGVESPRLRSAPWVSSVASGLVRGGANSDLVAWAILQAMQLGRCRSADDLRDAAKILLAMRDAVEAKDR